MKYFIHRNQLNDVVNKIVYFPHCEIHRGQIFFTKECFTSEDRDCNLFISPSARIDCTGNVTIDAWTMIGHGTVILTHDHYHYGRKPLLLLQEEKGINWSSLTIGKDVWLHNCTILNQVSKIPDGVVVGVNSTLTKDPGPYEIWAGCPARKIGNR